ncbi:MAG: phosphatidylserine decarboxylase [Polyangiaceae bacterium]|nr:phosphatidylserine decarboxylase [Polyangiaceae bacterium]
MAKTAGDAFKIDYVDRRTGELRAETVMGVAFVRYVYERALGRAVRRAILTRPSFSKVYGRYQSSRLSRRNIPGVISSLSIDMDDYVEPPGGFVHFNDFFTRRLRPGARPIDPRDERLVSPADGRLFAYTDVRGDTLVPAKGRRVSIEALLASPADAARFRGGTVLIVRLCPSDYHRFHFPCAGVASRAQRVAGPLESVNPGALAKGRPILDRNQREVTYLDTERFGRVAYLEVGAMCVGSVVQRYAAGAVAKGEEKGYFQVGGSTVILVLEPGRIVVDDDLVSHTRRGHETLVRMGEGIATAAG